MLDLMSDFTLNASGLKWEDPAVTQEEQRAWLKMLRATHDLTQGDLADFLGVSRPSVTAYEAKEGADNATLMSMGQIQKLVDEFGDVRSLVGKVKKGARGQALGAHEVGPQIAMQPEEEDEAFVPYGPPVPGGLWQEPDVIDPNRKVRVPKRWAGKNRVAYDFIGDSMTPVLEQGDLLVFQHTPTPRPGHIIIAKNQNGELTVKKLRQDLKGYTLAPFNKSYHEHALMDGVETWEAVGFLVAIRGMRDGNEYELFNPNGILTSIR